MFINGLLTQVREDFTSIYLNKSRYNFCVILALELVQ